MIKDEKLPKTVLLRVFAYLSLNEMIDVGIMLSNEWRRILCEDKLAS